MTKHFSLVVTLDGVLTGIAYWFNIHLSANNTLSTGPNSYSEVIQVPVLLLQYVLCSCNYTMKFCFLLMQGKPFAH